MKNINKQHKNILIYKRSKQVHHVFLLSKNTIINKNNRFHYKKLQNMLQTFEDF